MRKCLRILSATLALCKGCVRLKLHSGSLALSSFILKIGYIVFYCVVVVVFVFVLLFFVLFLDRSICSILPIAKCINYKELYMMLLPFDLLSVFA